MKGVTLKTEKVLTSVSVLESIKPFVLVGGTALSLQLGTRESEDLDFMSWRTSKNQKREVDWPSIKKDLETIGTVEKVDLLGLDHVEFVVNGVKISFYANPNYSPVDKIIPFLNNVNLADPMSIGAMKLEVMLRRSKFRDYYDIYSIIKGGFDLNHMVEKALVYSGHQMKSKNLLALLTRSDRFVPDTAFCTLNPVYDVKPKDIEEEIIKTLRKSNDN